MQTVELYPPNTAEWSPAAKLKQCKMCYCHWNLFYVWSLCSSSSFCTAGTTATRTQIRKLISYICYPSPRIPIKLIWRLNFHMSFIKLWDCLMLTNSSQCVSNWNKRTQLIQFVWRKNQMMCHRDSLQLHPGVLLNQRTQRKPSKKEFWIKLFHFSESEKCKAVFVLI